MRFSNSCFSTLLLRILLFFGSNQTLTGVPKMFMQCLLPALEPVSLQGKDFDLADLVFASVTA